MKIGKMDLSGLELLFVKHYKMYLMPLVAMKIFWGLVPALSTSIF